MEACTSLQVKGVPCSHASHTHHRQACTPTTGMHAHRHAHHTTGTPTTGTPTTGHHRLSPTAGTTTTWGYADCRHTHLHGSCPSHHAPLGKADGGQSPTPPACPPGHASVRVPLMHSVLPLLAAGSQGGALTRAPHPWGLACRGGLKMTRQSSQGYPCFQALHAPKGEFWATLTCCGDGRGLVARVMPGGTTCFLLQPV